MADQGAAFQEQVEEAFLASQATVDLNTFFVITSGEALSWLDGLQLFLVQALLLQSDGPQRSLQHRLGVLLMEHFTSSLSLNPSSACLRPPAAIFVLILPRPSCETRPSS